MSLTEGHYDSFVVRIWSKDGQVGHGQITHVATRDARWFRDLQDSIAFMLAHLQDTPDHPEQGATPQGKLDR